ncbi:MAG TPA: class I SAM-dependent methyltransferase [Solibacterales bacterium]|nr:class I SAM-dependent methyltransferase [Bryobacterales bacterium]
MSGYQADLAYIHDTGFGDFAREAAPGLLQILRRAGIAEGLVVDLGCGSGIWAADLLAAGYDVLGIDQSGAMIDLARRRAPGARFVQDSLLQAPLPKCRAVTSISECMNYLFDDSNSLKRLAALMRRVHHALEPGGVFVFDIAEHGLEPERRRGHWQGEGWVVMLDAEEDPETHIVTRDITTFRRAGKLWRRTDEQHRLRTFDRSEIYEELGRAGFHVKLLRGYGDATFPRAHAGYLARKPV